MIDEIRSFGKQFGIAMKLAKQDELPEFDQEFENIYLCGMGGSSLPGDLVNTILKDQVEIKFVRDYDIPKKNDYSKDFFVISSFSGNTEETLSCLEQVSMVTENFVVMSFGGKLKTIAEEKKYNFMQVPACSQPRLATGYFFTNLLVLLSQLGKIDLNWFAELQNLEDFLVDNVDKLEKMGMEIADELYKKMPIIYADASMKAMARVSKILFNENGKVQAFWNEIPEMNHNEMVGFTTMVTDPTIVLLKSKFMHSRNLYRMEVLESILGGKISFINVEAEGENLLQENFWVYGLMAFASYYLAKKYGVDPEKVEMVEEFKLKIQK